jgi:hypothetical protein
MCSGEGRRGGCGDGREGLGGDEQGRWWAVVEGDEWGREGMSREGGGDKWGRGR